MFIVLKKDIQIIANYYSFISNLYRLVSAFTWDNRIVCYDVRIHALNSTKLQKHVFAYLENNFTQASKDWLDLFIILFKNKLEETAIKASVMVPV